MNRRLLLLLLIALGALAFRLPRLDQRPLHNDEAINAFKLQTLWEKGQYAYDPDEYHGPALYYFSLPFLWLGPAQDAAQMKDATLRLTPVFFGVALILLLPLLRDGLGWGVILSAGVLTAISPAMVFYSRYFIHEMLFVFFTLLLLAAIWRYSQSSRLGWAILGGAALGLMYATKETFVLNVAAALAALFAARLVARCREGQPLRPPAGWVSGRHLLVAALAALVVAELFFSSFGTNARGPVDALRTYLPWLKRAGGHSPHIHPWYFYFEHLFWFQAPKGPRWSEGLILVLALVGSVVPFLRTSLPGVHTFLARSLVFYTWFLAAIYSVISYKTPWCLLGFLQPMILVAGLGVVALFTWTRGFRLKLLLSLLLLGGGTHLGWQACCANFQFAATWRNPYVYAQTVPDIYRLVEKVAGIAKVHPQGNRMLIKVISNESYWPLPWYLRHFSQVGWWDALPADPYAPVIIVNSRFQAYLDEKSNKKYLMVGHYELRPTVFLEMYVELDLWTKYVATLPKEREE
ncbi:MAG: flippase activity-associated protein Agl23 [Verrucomicrobiota bacterium]